MAARRNRFCKPDERSPGSPLAGLDYAYHFDATPVRALSCAGVREAQGVERIEGRITGVRSAAPPMGSWRQVVLADGRRVGGDLFVDCSGMRALLIGEAHGRRLSRTGRQWLPCDRALAVAVRERHAVDALYAVDGARRRGGNGGSRFSTGSATDTSIPAHTCTDERGRGGADRQTWTGVRLADPRPGPLPFPVKRHARLGTATSSRSGMAGRLSWSRSNRPAST